MNQRIRRLTVALIALFGILFVQLSTWQVVKQKDLKNKPGNMHAFLGSTDQDRARNLATLKSWLGDGAWNLNRWETRGNVPAITKEQLDKVKAKY